MSIVIELMREGSVSNDRAKRAARGWNPVIIRAGATHQRGGTQHRSALHGLLVRGGLTFKVL